MSLERPNYCSSCGRRHAPTFCTDTPRGADAWYRVLAARAKPSPPSLTDTTASDA